MTKNESTTKQGRLVIFWTILGILGSIAVFPYSMELNSSLLDQVPLSALELVLLQSVQIGIFLLIGNFIGLRLGASISLDSPIARAFVYRFPLPKLSIKNFVTPIVTGIAVGLIIIGLDFSFQPFMPAANQGNVPSIARWKGFLASFYGGITEELLLRLFLMTSLAWIIWKIFMRGKDTPGNGAYWVAIILAAILFGVGHLPAASLIWPLTPIVLFRIILLNAIPGVAFGYFYWKQGLEFAMLSHFCADILLHVFFAS